MSASPHLTRTVLWNRLDAPGLEYAMLQSYEQGWLIQGDAVTAISGAPARVVYQVRVDPAWKTHRLAVDVLVGARRQRLHMIHHARRGWRTRPENAPLPHLDGCIDVDLGLSPVLNTLAINRLALPVGASAAIVTAWVRFPDTPADPLTIVPRAQQYLHVAPNRYLYHSGDTPDHYTYAAMLDVDDLGLIISYEGAWERTHESDA